MLTDFFALLLRSPRLRSVMWRSWYDFLARSYRNPDWTFMNYGLDDPAVNSLILSAEDENDRLCMQLYSYVVGAVDLSGKSVLEVGCGRGGGSSFIARYLKTKSMTGVDLSAEAIAFCSARHPVPGLRFRTGNALSLPFEADCFDAVVNVESSHCYTDVRRFFREVHRVLKPGGQFLYADLHERAGLLEWRKSLMDSGLTIAREADITQQVLAALERDNARKLGLIDRFVPRLLRKSFYDFAGMRGSKIDRAFRSGGLMYGSFRAEKVLTYK